MTNAAIEGSEWVRLGPATQAVTPILACKGCGATKTQLTADPTDVFPSEHCGECPPWICQTCGGMDSATEHCPCWTDLTTMPLADQKAIFATDGGFNIGGRMDT
jgi:hypothetical protein